MRIFLFLVSLLCTFTVCGQKKEQPITVIITAGQSNTDGRVMNTDLPNYIQLNKYKYCQWCYGSTDERITGEFETFWPRIVHDTRPERWAFDAVTYYWLEQALQENFYVVKWALGGTAIDTTATSTGRKYWMADRKWLAANRSTATGGHSLLLSFTENIDAAIDNTLSNFPQGYEIKAFLWHQGESDCHKGKNYYENLKGVVEYVRSFLEKKTGNKKYKKLPFICGTVARANKRYDADVEAAIYQLAKDDKNFHVIDMAEAELQKDQLHFTAAAAEYLGIEMYNKLVDLGIAGERAKHVNETVRVAKYKDDKLCAISYTFDDGLKEHYTQVVPELEKRNFKGTFWINGSKINETHSMITDSTRMTRSQLKEMADKGHEISNHGWAHKNFGRHSLEEIEEDILKNDSAIQLYTGIKPLTFCYPHNTKTPEGIELASRNRVGTRTEQRSIGSKSTPEDLDKWVNTLIETNNWGVGMTHGITYGYDAFTNPAYFWNHMDKVKLQESKIWVGTFVEVAAYLKEQDNIKLTIQKKRDELFITPYLTLDKRLFNQPLTMVVDNIGNKKINATQKDRNLEIQYSNNKVIFEFDPWGGVVRIKFLTN